MCHADTIVQEPGTLRVRCLKCGTYWIWNGGTGFEQVPKDQKNADNSALECKDGSNMNGENYLCPRCKNLSVESKAAPLGEPCIRCSKCGASWQNWNAYDCDLERATEKSSDTGLKHDAGKPMWHLLPWTQLKNVVQVLTAPVVSGKYPAENWKKVPDARNRYFSACMRHLTAWWDGEKNDPDDGLPHLAHAACCLFFLMWFDDQADDALKKQAKEYVEEQMNGTGL